MCCNEYMEDSITSSSHHMQAVSFGLRLIVAVGGY